MAYAIGTDKRDGIVTTQKDIRVDTKDPPIKTSVPDTRTTPPPTTRAW